MVKGLVARVQILRGTCGEALIGSELDGRLATATTGRDFDLQIQVLPHVVVVLVLKVLEDAFHLLIDRFDSARWWSYACRHVGRFGPDPSGRSQPGRKHAAEAKAVTLIRREGGALVPQRVVKDVHACAAGGGIAR